MIYPINYDFGKNWDTKVKPFLEHPKIKKAIVKGVNSYLSIFPNNHKYKKNTPPAQYSSKDWYVTIRDRQEEIIMEKLRTSNQLSKEFLDFEAKIQEHGDYCIGDDDENDPQTLYDMQQEILAPYFSWDKIKYDILSYCLSGSCHWWSPTFELTLAKLVEPEIKWKVQRGNDHTTVISQDKKRVFDLLYWSCDDRIDNYIFNDPIPNDKIDPTLGGKQAFIDSMT